MKKIPVFLIMLFFFILSGSFVYADQWVRGHYRSNGTYVQGYYRSSPDSSRYNNYSTKGNTNPYTRKRGYKDPYSSAGQSLLSPNQRHRSQKYKSLLSQ